MRTFKEMLENRKMFKTITIFFDIETYQYNEDVGKDFPSDYKNMTFSVAVSWIEKGIVEYEIFPNFKKMFDTVFEVYGKSKKIPLIKLNAHNTNKYDNHFLRKDLLYFYPHMKVENYWLQTATTEDSNKNAYKIKDLKAEDKKGMILEKRIKSSINLEMVIFLYGVKFETEDNWVKTNSSISMLGKKLKRLGVVTDDELKTDFDYLKYNLKKDLTDEQAREYAQEIYNQLSNDELVYIRNDVILLAKSVYYYSDIFKGFDYSKKTFTSNILESYNTNNLTSFQLLNRIGQGKEKLEIRYTDYQFSNQNFYDYLKPFYRGGLNFYNQFFIGKIINNVFGMDIHSSYPYAMHNFKIPTYIKDYEEHEKPKEVNINYSDDEYSLFQISKETFDHMILDQIDSVILKQILVKYYSTNDFININTFTFKMIDNITGLKFDSIPAYSRVTFITEYFGSREQIEKYYEIKTQGSYEEKLIFNNPYDIQKTEQENDVIYSREEIDNSKVNLNGLYGIPALRPYFNLFRKDNEGEYYNVENGHKNAERNIVFSIFVTSVSLWNLLNPLKYLTQQEIDDNFIYCDTDSLYFKKDIQEKIPKHLFSEFKLGTWDLEHEHIKQFYVLNHKKYAYVDEENEIQVKAGGIPNDSFNRNLPFDEFIRTQFSDGVEIKTLKSIYNNQETISIYPSITHLEIGQGYRIYSSGKLYDRMKSKMFEDIRKQVDEFNSDVLYIESIIGTFSLSDMYPFTHEIKQKEPLIFLELKQEQIRNIINNS